MNASLRRKIIESKAAVGPLIEPTWGPALGALLPDRNGPPSAADRSAPACATELDRLYGCLNEVTTKSHPRTARLLAAGTPKTAQKVIEEAGEVALEAVKHRSAGVVRESADLLYHLVVLWRRAGIGPDEIWTEMQCRANALGITEKLPKPAVGNPKPSKDRPSMHAKDTAMSVMNEPGELATSIQASATLDDAHVGHVHGAFGTILHGDHGPRIGWRARVKTLLAILGPGLRSLSITLERPRHGVEQILIAKRLRQEVNGAFMALTDIGISP
jgi:phosphoribosyl-ATP pyrophosphohydrolase